MGQVDQVFGCLFLGLGPGAVVYSVYSIARTREFLRGCVETSGEVIRLERSSGGRFGPENAPVFTFVAADGKAHTVTSEVYSSPPGFSEGDSVLVRYDPANPEDARIHTFFQTWGGAVIWGIVGAAFIGFGLNTLGLFQFK